MSPRSVVIAGYGMAGARLAEEILRRDPGGEHVVLTVLGEEPHLAYNRVLLSGVVAGSMKPELGGLGATTTRTWGSSPQE